MMFACFFLSINNVWRMLVINEVDRNLTWRTHKSSDFCFALQNLFFWYSIMVIFGLKT